MRYWVQYILNMLLGNYCNTKILLMLEFWEATYSIFTHIWHEDIQMQTIFWKIPWLIKIISQMPEWLWTSISEKKITETRNLPHSGWYPREWICYKDIVMKAQSLNYFSSSLKYLAWAFLTKISNRWYFWQEQNYFDNQAVQSILL